MTGDANDGWTQAVRSRLGLGRLLPLGGAADGTWIAESAAAAVLLQAADDAPGLVVGTLRIAQADPGGGDGPAVPPPPSALPPGPLRIEVEVDGVAGGESLPAVVDRLRDVLFAASAERLGLVVTAVDVRVTGLLETSADRRGRLAPDRGTATAQGTAAEAAAAVPGVARLTGVMGAPVQETPGQLRVEIAVAAGHRVLDVALSVRAAVAGAVVGERPVGVLVTAVELR